MDFNTNIIDGATIWSTVNLPFSINNELFDPSWVQQNTQIQAEAQGRGQAIFFEYGGKSMVQRHYHRGGLLGRINKDLFLRRKPTLSRGYSELALLALMERLNLPVPSPIAARFDPSGIVYRADILIEEIPNAITVLEALKNNSMGTDDWEELGRTIAKFHAHGIDHTDLNIRNILLDQKRKFWLIDFDKCSQRPLGQWSQGNLARLKRSLEKENVTYQFNGYSTANWQALIDMYKLN